MLVTVTAACSDGVDGRADPSGKPSDPTRDEPSGSPPDDREALVWDDCGDLECGMLEVPLDHFAGDENGDENGETITIALTRRPANEADAREGAILLNPGGPGAAGQWMVEALAGQFPDAVLDRFDLVAWDPRGTGDSTAVDCGADFDAFFATDKSPDTRDEEAANVAAAEAVADACWDAHAELLPFLSTTQTVEDIDAIRVALGDDQLSYLGVSYGTYLGARYAETHPDRVRAFVLDGPVDPSLAPETTSLDQSIGFERALAEFFEWCEGNDDCAFTPSDPRSAFVRLMAQIDAEELYAEVDGDERGLGPGEADLGVAVTLYSGADAYDFLATALAEAAQGDGSRLLEFSDLYTGRLDNGRYDGSMAAFYAIGCVDSPRLSLAEVRDLASELETAAPFLGESGVWLSLPCTYWPVAADPGGTPHRIELPAGTAVLVAATNGDPATPIEWARGLSEQLPAPLLVADSSAHGAFTSGDDCVADAIIEFLLDPEADVAEC